MIRDCRFIAYVLLVLSALLKASVMLSTSLRFSRVKEHHKEMESITGAITRAESTRAANICNKSAITDHMCNKKSCNRLGKCQGDWTRQDW